MRSYRVFEKYFLLIAIWLFLPISDGDAQLRDRGMWNGFLEQLNVVECTNTQLSPAQIRIRLKDQFGTTIGEAQETVPANGTRHVILNQFSIRDRIGTYEVELIYTSNADRESVNCLTAVYRLSGRPEELLDYAYVLPALVGMRGTTSGLYNSYNPANAPQPTLNWLSINNLESESFSGNVEVYPIGSSVPSSVQPIRIDPQGRIDIALGHPSGQTAGMYRIVPDSAARTYSATLMRYGGSAGKFEFAFPLTSRVGTCDTGLIPASTMGPANNWFEVANAADTVTPVRVEVRNSGGELLNQYEITLRPREQQHLFLNSDLGELRTGTVRVRCTQHPGEGRLIAHSSFYAYGAGGSTAWAYASQPKTGLDKMACGQIAPVNTYFNAANWLKTSNAGSVSLQADLRLLSAEGVQLSAPQIQPIASGGILDTALHGPFARDTIGLAAIKPGPKQAIEAAVLRSFPDVNGDIGTIMEVPAQPVYCAEFFGKNVASEPASWSKVLEHPEFRRTPALPVEAFDFLERFSDYSGRPVDITVRRPRLGANPAEIEVEAPGAANYSASAAIKAAISAARNAGPSVIRFPEAVYLITPQGNLPHVDLSGLEDVVVDGQGSTLIFTNARSFGIFVRDNRRIILKNFNFDWNFEAAVAADVVGSLSDPDYRELVVAGGRSINPVDYDGIYTFNYVAKLWNAYPDGQRLLFEGGPLLSEIRPGVYTHPNLKKISAGRRVILISDRHGKRGTVSVQGARNEDLNFEFLQFWNTPQMHLYATGVRGLRIANCTIGLSPDESRLTAGRADVFHIGGTRGDVVIEDNTASHQGDDGLNYRGLDFYVSRVLPDQNAITLELAPDRETNRTWELELYERGDLLALTDENQTPLGFVRVSKVLNLDGTPVVGIPTALKLIVEPDANDPLPLIAAGTRGFNLSKSSSRYIVRRNHFSNGAARGMLINAPNGLVERNTIAAVRSSGILAMTFTQRFYEGPGAVNVIMRRNNLRRTNNTGGVRNYPAGAMTLFADDPTGEVEYPRLQDILLANNTIEDVQGLAFQISHSRNIRVLNNNLINANTLPFLPPLASDTTIPRGSIMLQKSCNVNLAGNQREDQGSSQELYADPATTCNVIAQNDY